MREDATFATGVYPAFRPDKALTVDQPGVFNPWLDRLSASSGIDCNGFPALLEALRQRHDAFHALGARLSDHGLNVVPDADCTDAEAARIFDTARAGGRGFAAGRRKIPRPDDALLRAARCGEIVDEAAPPRGVAECELADAARSWGRIRGLIRSAIGRRSSRWRGTWTG